MPDLKVTIVQSDLHWEAIESTLAMFDETLDTVQEATDLIVLPEMFSTGFSMQADALAEPMNGKAVGWMRRKAGEMNTVITGSLMIREADCFYNRLVWMRPDGTLATYDKKHLFRFAGEDKVFTAGREPITLDLKGWKIRPFICYDLRFPIWTRNLGPTYDAALFVANWPTRRSAHWRALLQARAIENQAFVIGVNRVGKDGKALAHDGRSTVIAPTGETLLEVVEQEAIKTIVLKHSAIAEFRRTFPAWMDADDELIRSTETEVK